MIAVMIGIGLAASCGFRVFVPMLVAGVTIRTGILDAADGFAWLGSTSALLALAIATVLEIGAYYVPWLDNLLDSIATPLAITAGVVQGLHGTFVRALDVLHVVLDVPIDRLDPLPRGGRLVFAFGQ